MGGWDVAESQLDKQKSPGVLIREQQQHKSDELAASRDPTPFLLPTVLEFQGVVGHSTAATEHAIANRERVMNTIDLAIVGTDAAAFAFDGNHSFWIGAAGSEPRPLRVRFTPLKAGASEAVLLVNHAWGQQHVQLRGSAMEGDNRKTPKMVGEVLPSVSPLSQEDPAKNGTSSKERMQSAARHLAEVVERYNALAPSGAAAATQFKGAAVPAGRYINERITTWLRDEGIDDVKKLSSQSGALVPDLIKGAIAKVLEVSLEAAEFTNIYAKIGMFIIDHAMDAVIKHEEKKELNDQSAQATEHLQAAAAASGKTLSDVNAYLQTRIDAVSSGFGATDGVFRRIANVEIPRLIHRLSQDLPEVSAGNVALGDRDYEEARVMLESFSAAETSWHIELSNVAAFGASLTERLEAAFANMLDRYIAARHSQVRLQSDHEAAEASEKLSNLTGGVHLQPKENQALELKVSGNIDFEKKQPVELNRLALEGAGHAGATVIHHLARKRLADLGAYEVKIALWHSRFGKLVLEQKQNVRSCEMNDEMAAEVNRTGGIDRIWTRLEDMDIGGAAGEP